MDPLDELRLATAALREREALAARRNELLVKARDAGAPWREIQAVTGLTRQAAYEAYQRGKRKLRGES